MDPDYFKISEWIEKEIKTAEKVYQNARKRERGRREKKILKRKRGEKEIPFDAESLVFGFEAIELFSVHQSIGRGLLRKIKSNKSANRTNKS